MESLSTYDPNYEMKRLARWNARAKRAEREEIKATMVRTMIAISVLSFVAWFAYTLGHDIALGLI